MQAVVTHRGFRTASCRSVKLIVAVNAGQRATTFPSSARVCSATPLKLSSNLSVGEWR